LKGHYYNLEGLKIEIQLYGPALTGFGRRDCQKTSTSCK
jgi:hypothetical protein